MTTIAQRHKLGTLMDLLVAHEPTVHYQQVRPMSTAGIKNVEDLKARLEWGIHMDCSESVTLLCRLAGMKDPNGLDYNGSGYTGTLLAHLPHYSRATSANVGALVVFGSPPGHHVCMVRHPGPDPLLFSHGQERGPFYLHLSDEARAQTPPYTFLSVAKL